MRVACNCLDQHLDGWGHIGSMRTEVWCEMCEEPQDCEVKTAHRLVLKVLQSLRALPLAILAV